MKMATISCDDMEYNLDDVEIYPLERGRTPELGFKVSYYIPDDIKIHVENSCCKFADVETWMKITSQVIDESSFTILINDVGSSAVFSILMYLKSVPLTPKRKAAFVYCLSRSIGRIAYLHMSENFSNEYTNLVSELFPKNDNVHFYSQSMKKTPYTSLLEKDHILTTDEYEKYSIEGILLSSSYSDDLYENKSFIHDLISLDMTRKIPHTIDCVRKVVERIHDTVTWMKYANYIIIMAYGYFLRVTMYMSRIVPINPNVMETIESINRRFYFSNITIPYMQTNIMKMAYLLGIPLDLSENELNDRLYDAMVQILIDHRKYNSKLIDMNTRLTHSMMNQSGKFIDIHNHSSTIGIRFDYYLPFDIIRHIEGNFMYHVTRDEFKMIIDQQINPYTWCAVSYGLLEKVKMNLDVRKKYNLPNDIVITKSFSEISKLIDIKDIQTSILECMKYRPRGSIYSNSAIETIRDYAKVRISSIIQRSTSANIVFAFVSDLILIIRRQFDIDIKIEHFFDEMKSRQLSVDNTVRGNTIKGCIHGSRSYEDSMLTCYKKYLDHRPVTSILTDDDYLSMMYVHLKAEHVNNPLRSIN